MNNTPFGMNVYYVQRTFSEDSKDNNKEKDSFWKKHKKKILAAAALAAAGGLGAATWNTKPVKKARAKVAQAIAPEITLDDIMDSPEAQKAVEVAQKAGDAIREKGEAAKNKIQEWGKSLGFSDLGTSEAQRQFADADKKASFWQKHKRKILAGAALAGAGALGALGYANKDKIANVFTSDSKSKPAPTPIGKSAKQALTTATQWVEKLTFANDDDWVIDLDIIAKNLEIAAKDEGTRTQALSLRDKVVRMIDGDLTKIEQRRPSVTDPAKLKKADMLLQMAKAQRNRLVSIQ